MGEYNLTFDDSDKLNDLEAESFGDPKIIPYGVSFAVEFNGECDGLLLDFNPLEGLSEFSIEIIFYQTPGGNFEQRFFHAGQVTGERVLFESRYLEDQTWYLDTFMASGESECALLNEEHKHPCNNWYHLGMVFDGKTMTNYVNHQQERQGEVEFTPQAAGKMSLGMRQNQVSWFDGMLHCIQVTPKVLSPSEFISMNVIKDLQT